MRNGLVYTWQQFLAMGIGCAVAVAITLSLFHLKRRRRRAGDERPPQGEKILRPAGYSALGRVVELADKLMRR